VREEKFLNLLAQKRGFFEAILDLTEEEAKYSTAEWLSILKQKKVLLVCIDKIDEELTHFKDAFEVLSKEMLHEIEKTKEVIEHILFIDEINCEKRKLNHFNS
jgi:hypothetical protein